MYTLATIENTLLDLKLADELDRTLLELSTQLVGIMGRDKCIQHIYSILTDVGISPNTSNTLKTLYALSCQNMS